MLTFDDLQERTKNEGLGEHLDIVLKSCYDRLIDPTTPRAFSGYKTGRYVGKSTGKPRKPRQKARMPAAAPVQPRKKLTKYQTRARIIELRTPEYNVKPRFIPYASNIRDHASLPDFLWHFERSGMKFSTEGTAAVFVDTKYNVIGVYHEFELYPSSGKLKIEELGKKVQETSSGFELGQYRFKVHPTRPEKTEVKVPAVDYRSTSEKLGIFRD